MHEFIVPDWPAPANVHALSTTRGTGPGRYGGFNLATHVGDDPVAVATHRSRLRERLPVAPLWLTQVHGVRWHTWQPSLNISWSAGAMSMEAEFATPKRQET